MKNPIVIAAAILSLGIVLAAAINGCTRNRYTVRRDDNVGFSVFDKRTGERHVIGRDGKAKTISLDGDVRSRERSVK